MFRKSLAILVSVLIISASLSGCTEKAGSVSGGSTEVAGTSNETVSETVSLSETSQREASSTEVSDDLDSLETFHRIEGETVTVNYPEVLDITEADLAPDSPSVIREYSSDGSVYIWQDFENGKAILVDGDLFLSLDIPVGHYGAYVEKCDADGDGEAEYLITDCEGTGSSFCVYGLCIVKKTDEGFKLVRYNGDYFADILHERITTEYSKGSGRVQVYIDGETDRHNSSLYLKDLIAEQGEDFAGLSFGDIIRPRLAAGRVWLECPVGLIFENNNVPRYEDIYNITAPITVFADCSVEVGDIRSFPDLSYNVATIDPPAELQKVEVYSCEKNVTPYEGNQTVEVSFYTASEFRGEVDDSLFDYVGIGYVRVYTDNYLLWAGSYGLPHTGNFQYFLTTVDGQDYMVVTSLYSGQGTSYYEYEVFMTEGRFIYSVDSMYMEFETDSKTDTKDFFDGLYRWINDSSVLLAAADTELEGIWSNKGILYSTEGNELNPRVYYSKKR